MSNPQDVRVIMAGRAGSESTLSSVAAALLDQGINTEWAEQPPPGGAGTDLSVVIVAASDDVPHLVGYYGDDPSLRRPSILAVCPESSANALELIRRARRAGADDILIWPAEEDLLGGRVVALVSRAASALRERRQDQQANVLREVAEVFGRADRLDAAIQDALWRFVHLTPVERCTLLLPTGEAEFYLLAASSDDDASIGLPVRCEEFPEVGLVIGKGEEIHRPAQDARGEGWWIPMRSHAQVIGVLEVLGSPSTPLTAPFDQFARALAAFLAPCIRLSDLHDSLQERAQPRSSSEMQALLRQREIEKYREFFRRSADGIAVLDAAGRALYINPMAEQISGFSSDGMVGHAFVDLIAAEDHDAFNGFVGTLMAGQSRGLFDLRMVTTSGDSIIASFSGTPAEGQNGLVILNFRDITDRRYLSEELRRTAEFLERLIDSGDDAIIASDVDGHIVLFNRVAERIFGRSTEEVVGRWTLDDLYPEGLADRLREQMGPAESGEIGRLRTFRSEVVNAEGEKIPVQMSANLIFENGEEVGTVANISDLRERLGMERRLLQAQERLVETEKHALIAELAGTTAHELNQPLTSIMGYAELLQRRIPQEDQNRRAAEVIYTESQRMADIVRQIGRITRYETKTYVGATQILDLEKSSD